MRYDYYCSNCGHIWEEDRVMDERDVPLSNACSKCNTNWFVKRGFFKAPGMSYNGAYTLQQRAGSEFNDLLKGIKKGSGRQSTIQTR